VKKFFIVAGDPSGDIHASKLMLALKSKSEDIEFIGIGGREMTSAGLNSIAPIEQMSVVGFWEVAKKYKFFKNIMNECTKNIQNEKIDAFIPVDYPGFNIRLSKKAKENNVPVIYYIAPQLWAWGKNRAKKIAGNTDLLLTVLPFEKDYFLKYGINAKYVGHPLLDNPLLEKAMPEFDERENLIALLPGSREQEIKQHLPIMEEIVNKFVKDHPEYKVGVAITNKSGKEILSPYLNKYKNWILFRNSLELMLKAKIGIVKTGTSNLEAALCGMPFVMVYKTSGLTFYLSKRLINLQYISLVNILLNQKVISEYIQKDINIQKMNDELMDLISNKDRFEGLQRKFQTVRKILGEKGASDNAADAILSFLSNK
jgi:lipid-A-disaccharide synthase